MRVIVTAKDSPITTEMEGTPEELGPLVRNLYKNMQVGTAIITLGNDAPDNIFSGTRPSLEGIDLASIEEIFEWTSVKADLYRVVVMTEFAMRADREGLDYETAKAIYKALELELPSDIKIPFRNASNTKGYLQSLGKNLWAPTDTGRKYVQRQSQLAEANRLINTPGNTVVEGGAPRTS